MFYCSIIKVQGLYPTFLTNNSLLVFTDLLFASAIYILSLSFQLVKNFFILFFEVFQKNKTWKSLRFPTFAPIRKTLLSSLVPSSLCCDSDMYLTTFNCCCQHFFHFSSLTFQPYKKLIYSGFNHSGEGGIRTHAPLRTNGFQDRLVMTTSIPLQTV